MKIFIVSSNLFKGGAEHVGVLLANGFAEKGHSVYLLSDTNLPVAYVIGDKVHVKGVFPRTANKLEKWMRSVGYIRREVKDIRPDVVIGIAETCSLVSKLACVGMNFHVIYTAHNSFERPETAPMGRWNKMAKFWLGRFYSKVTALTDADKVFIGKRLKNVSVMPNPLGLRPVHEIPHKQNAILAVGRLDGWHVKGFDVLIKSFAKLLNGSKVAEPRSKFKSNDIAFKIREEGWKLQIAGTGSEESLNYLKQLCKENGVESFVEFLGFKKDVEKLYQDASIFVLSSRYEGFGLVLIEAMSQGCACIACDYKGRQREIIAPNEGECLDSSLKFQDSSVDGQKESEDIYVPNSKISQKQEIAEEPQTRNLKPETRNLPVEACEIGILCEPDNVEALSDAMTKMIMDEKYRESTRQNAIERSKYYSIDRTMDRWEQLLNQLK